MIQSGLLIQICSVEYSVDIESIVVSVLSFGKIISIEEFLHSVLKEEQRFIKDKSEYDFCYLVTVGDIS